ncbi:DUF4190 domain-containing protein [Demequina activiva]|uniref:DUF4190 domain-containing protein n=1 Tax=Demequina activiva TaxID=1582364 RepID=A0A919Q361_9MICO|nr:DUF4190 domain-containing protein [Demequina activiva]GIG54036.1 hypothetical protein Dac01nite_07880 [Demequina activiva]
MTQPDEHRPDEQGPDQPREDGAIVAPDDWYSGPAGATNPASTPVPLDGGPAVPPPHPGSRGEQALSLEGVTFDRATEHNRRAVVGMVLSGLALAGLLAWFVGFSTPVLVVLVLAISGMVLGVRGRAAARNGLATNKRLALAAIITGAVAVVGIIAIYGLLLYALSQFG